MRTLKTLIDECVTVCDSQASLARRLGVTSQDVNHLVKGKRTLSPTLVAMLCDVLQLEGVEAQRLAAEAVIASAKPEKQGVLRRAFFGLRGTGAEYGEAAKTAIGVFGTMGLTALSAAIRSTMYIM